jgi:hypothetical protein
MSKLAGSVFTGTVVTGANIIATDFVDFFFAVALFRDVTIGNKTSAVDGAYSSPGWLEYSTTAK